MKHAVLIAFALLAGALVLPSCVKQAPSEPTAGSAGAPIEVTTDDDAVYLSDYLASEAFDKAAAGIQDGSRLPNGLHFYFANSADGNITLQENILEIWQRLCGVRIDIRNPNNEIAIDDGEAIFTFTWDDGSSIRFTFCTSEYYDDHGTLYPTVPSSLVSSILNDACNLIEYAQDAPQYPMKLASDCINSFKWDGDGDGSEEQYLVQYIDLGDEAPSVTEISRADDPEIKLSIPSAYGVKQVEPSADQGGHPALTVTYYEGDYYGHDTLATVEITYDAGKIALVER